MTVCQGDDVLRCSDAVRVGHHNVSKQTTKILPRIRPPAHGSEITEGVALEESMDGKLEVDVGGRRTGGTART